MFPKLSQGKPKSPPKICISPSPAEKDSGTITAGKFADVIAVRGDVLRHIDLLSRVDVVIKHGVRYK